MSPGTNAARRCAVLGSPIRHSLSPVLHHTAYDVLGLDWSYDAVEMAEGDLAGFLDGLDGAWRGLSLTMPLKRAVVALADELGEHAVRAGAANTLVIEGGRRVAENTDVPGLCAALRERYDGPVATALILGGGATAASALLGLADLGCREVTLRVRDQGRAAETVAAAGRHPAPPRVVVLGPDEHMPNSPAPDVVVSTIPASAQTDALLSATEGAGVVFDVVYDPWPTPLALRAARDGQVLVAGLDLLVHQAVLQVELMTGSAAGLATGSDGLSALLLEPMRRAGAGVLAARAAGRD